jgi:UDP-N-acetylglucosamine pyrophosphorylase
LELPKLTFLSSDWDRIKSPAADQIIPYDSLPKPADHKNLGKLAVLKVNGGLGTSMGESAQLASALAGN